MPARRPDLLQDVARRLRAGAERVLARADLAVVHRSNYERWLDEAPVYEPPADPGPTDPELRPDNPRLLELRERYRSHPAAASSQWSDTFVEREINLALFRGDNAYVWQRRLNMQPVNYALTTFYLQRHSRLPLLETLTEDNRFGVTTHSIDGTLVSRDLLDSITELSFLEEELGLSQLERPTILDIGAGYGRLAHRATSAFDLTYLCTDGVALSSFLCEHYLRSRGAVGAEVLPLDEVEGALGGRRIDLAVNVHSFSECPYSVVGWWLDLLVANDVEHLMIVPNTEDLLTTEATGARRDFSELIRAHGFTLVKRRPKYAHSDAVQQHGIYPAQHYLFRRQ